MLDWTALVERHSHPFNWALVTGLLSTEMAAALISAFPETLSHTVRTSGSDKTYNVRNRVMLSPSCRGVCSTEIWQCFLDDVRSQRYRDFMEATIDRSLRDAILQVEVNEYQSGGFMSVHTDRLPKIVSHLIYLNERWCSSWGGALTLRESPNADPAVRLRPALPTSVVLIRGDTSWHQVDEVTTKALDPRRTIQITFWEGHVPQSRRGRRVLP